MSEEPGSREASVDVSELAPGDVRDRQCGRCRAWFPGDPDAHATALGDWWVCTPCRSRLLGGG